MYLTFDLLEPATLLAIELIHWCCVWPWKGILWTQGDQSFNDYGSQFSQMTDLVIMQMHPLMHYAIKLIAVTCNWKLDIIILRCSLWNYDVHVDWSPCNFPLCVAALLHLGPPPPGTADHTYTLSTKWGTIVLCICTCNAVLHVGVH